MTAVLKCPACLRAARQVLLAWMSECVDDEPPEDSEVTGPRMGPIEGDDDPMTEFEVWAVCSTSCEHVDTRTKHDDDQTLEQVALVEELTKERIRQIEAGAMDKLRHDAQLAQWVDGTAKRGPVRSPRGVSWEDVDVRHAKVLALLAKAPLTPRQVALALGVDVHAARASLLRLRARGQAEQVPGGVRERSGLPWRRVG